MRLLSVRPLDLGRGVPHSTILTFRKTGLPLYLNYVSRSDLAHLPPSQQHREARKVGWLLGMRNGGGFGDGRTRVCPGAPGDAMNTKCRELGKVAALLLVTSPRSLPQGHLRLLPVSEPQSHLHNADP